MYKALSPGAMGIKTSNLQEAIDIAHKAGFEGVEFSAAEVADLVDAQGADAVIRMFTDAHLQPAGWGLPVDWRGAEDTWRAGVAALPRQAAAAAAIGCDRAMTWVMPCSDEMPYDQNYQFHVERFKPVAEALQAAGCRLGLEFIGPKTMRDSKRFPFIHTMEAMLAMGSAIGPNVGLLLDSFHWHTSGGTTDDLRELNERQIVYVHVNDAPLGVPIEKQLDGVRALPGATGGIDIRGFLCTLQQIGYAGPVTPEPFGTPATWALDSLKNIWKQAGL